MITGSVQVRVRYGWSDFETFGSGNYACAATGNLDAVDFMPQGSVRVHNTMRPNPVPSIGHRDWESRAAQPIGCSHDGPEPATLWLSA